MAHKLQPGKPGRPRSSTYRAPARKMASEGLGATAISKELDISVVWVYYLAGDIFRERRRRLANEQV